MVREAIQVRGPKVRTTPSGIGVSDGRHAIDNHRLDALLRLRAAVTAQVSYVRCLQGVKKSDPSAPAEGEDGAVRVL